MKKFAKVTGIVSLVLLIVAVVFITVGTIGGGATILRMMALNGDLTFGPEDLNFPGIQRKFSIQYDVDSDVMFDRRHEVFSASSFYEDMQGEEVTGLEVSVGGGEVDILLGENDYWEVSVEGVSKYQVYVENGILCVRGAQSGLNVDFGDITIWAPEQGAKLLNAGINLAAGDMSISYLAAEHLEIAVGAGALTIEEVDIDNLEMSVGAGEIILEEGDIDNLEAAVGMGAIKIEAFITGNIDGSVSMGELEITVEGSVEDDHNYEISCGAGEVIVGGRSHAGVNVTTELNNDADTTYELNCALGSICVKFKD